MKRVGILSLLALITLVAMLPWLLGWFFLNQQKVIHHSEEESLHTIIAKCDDTVDPADLAFVAIGSQRGMNAGTLKTFRVSSGGKAIATISLNSFLNIGWQEASYERLP
ncbi:MAG: hypothetical protein AAF514_14305 [Verrucomicrobiota bacterium]